METFDLHYEFSPKQRDFIEKIFEKGGYYYLDKETKEKKFKMLDSPQVLLRFANTLCAKFFDFHPDELPDVNILIDDLTPEMDADEFIELVEDWYNERVQEIGG